MVRDYVTGYGSQIAIFGKEMNVTRDRQSCAQVKDNCDDQLKLRRLFMVQIGMDIHPPCHYKILSYDLLIGIFMN